MQNDSVYVCSELVALANGGDYTCKQWVIDSSYQSAVAFSQSDAQIIGEFLISFFVLCAAYAVIAKAIKLA